MEHKRREGLFGMAAVALLSASAACRSFPPYKTGANKHFLMVYLFL